MKKSLTLMLAATSAFFFACSDDSSSDNGTGGNGGKVTIEYSGSIKVDAENQTMVVAIPEKEEACVNEDAGVYKWRTVDFGTDTSYSKYMFVGDTLVIIDCDEMDDEGKLHDCDYGGQMLVGGKKGNVNGTWRAVPCMYDTEDTTSICFKPCSEVKGGKLTDEEMDKALTVRRSLNEDEDLLTAMTAPVTIDSNLIDRMTCLTPEELTKKGFNEGTVTISGNSISAKVTSYYKVDTDDDVFDDYMNSEFMSRFYSNLADGDPSLPGFGNLDEEDSSDVERYRELAGVTVLKQTKNSVSFKFLDKTFSLNVKEYSKSIDKVVTAFGIEFDGTRCDFQEEYGEVTKNTCTSNYGEFFDKDTEKDADGNSITVAYEYEKSNYKIFDNCIDNMMDSIYALIESKNKSSDDDGDDCAALSAAYSRCMLTSDIEEYYDLECPEVVEDYTECAINAPTTADNSVRSLNKKAIASREQAKKEFLKVSRKFARMLKKLAE
ncbi:MAG: hypothetical protein IJ909_10505 [Fibrobacter sp.]|nr:hypothetical protein [Fibrobacter sp.]